MLTAVFPKLTQLKFVQLVRAFFRSYWYPAIVAALMAASEIFGIELIVYYIYLAFGAVCVLLCEDMLGAVPIVCCGYMTFSAMNNPGKHPETSIFTRPAGYMHLVMILACGVILLVGRFILCLFELPKKRMPRLTLGYFALGLAYILGGLFTQYYLPNTVLYGFVQIVSIAFFYYFFYYSVDWTTVKKEYIVGVFFLTGIGMLAEIIGMYFLPGVVVNGEVVRSALYTGWGVYNNVGCIMAMCMPAAFYFAAVKKFGWFYTFWGCLFYLGVLLTQSRGSILFGTVVFIGCVIFSLVKAKGMEKLGVFIVLGVFVLAATVSLIVLRGKLASLFYSVLLSGTDDSGRFSIYKRCWEAFLSSPSFGVGFYKTPGAVLTGGSMLGEAPPGSFIPARAHDTIFQLLATGGVFAIAAYAFHRTQTMLLFFRKPSPEKTFVFLSVAALLLTSLLDCNFFNIGPGLLYSVLLVYAESTDGLEPRGKHEKYKFLKRKKKETLAAEAPEEEAPAAPEEQAPQETNETVQ